MSNRDEEELLAEALEKTIATLQEASDELEESNKALEDTNELLEITNELAAAALAFAGWVQTSSCCADARRRATALIALYAMEHELWEEKHERRH